MFIENLWSNSISLARIARQRQSVPRRRPGSAIALVGAAWLVLTALPLFAQNPEHPVQHDAVSQHHRIQYELMKHMSDEMARMTDEMAQNNVTPERRKQMVRRMERMSILMHHMSGLWSRPAMSEPKMKQEMDTMRREMDAMMRDRAMQPGVTN